jgi:hypothetical protein
VRRDLITLLPAIFGFILLLAAPFGAYFLFSKIFPSLLTNSITLPLTILFASIYFLSVGLFFYTYFVNFYLDLLIITNDRLLHINQIGMFARSISEVDLYKIQDITSKIDGFFPALFKYGDLLIQTAGTQEKFMIYNVPDPEGLRQIILDLAEEDRKFHSLNSTQPTP